MPDWGRAPEKLRGLDLALELASADEDGEQEDELDEREGDQHCGLQFADGFRLSGHALHSAVSDEAETDAAAKCGETECEWEHDFSSFLQCVPCGVG